MATNTQSALSSGGYSADTPAKALQNAADLSSFWRRMGASVSVMLKNYQVSQMKSVLMGMNDAQLSQIGIRRSEIANYAEQLVEE